MSIRVLYVTEARTPYRSGWFEKLDNSDQIDLTVGYLRTDQADRPWQSGLAAHAFERELKTLQVGLISARDHSPVALRRPGALLRMSKPDVVILPGWAHPACAQLALLCRAHRIPYGVVFETWRSQSETPLPRGVTTRIRDLILTGAAVSLPIGQRALAFANEIGAPNPRLVHANSCDAMAVQASTAGVVKHSEPTVLFAGRLLPHKGADLLEPVAGLLDRVGVRLRIIGSGEYLDSLKRAAASLEGLAVLGSQPSDEVLDEMAKAWCVVVPSREEPWGVVVHEALAARTPVVATNTVGATADFSYFDGRQLPPPEPQALCDEVLARMTARTLHSAVGAEVSHEQSVGQLVEALQTLKGGRPTSQYPIFLQATRNRQGHQNSENNGEAHA